MKKYADFSKNIFYLAVFFVFLLFFVNYTAYAEEFTVPQDASPECSWQNGKQSCRFNWQNYGLAPVRDQGHCGSCWAFGAVGAVEDIITLAQNSIGLSREFLVGDCGCDGSCYGGYAAKALAFLEDTGTITGETFAETLSNYPSYNCLKNVSECKNECRNVHVYTNYDKLTCTATSKEECPTNFNPIKVKGFKKIKNNINLIKQALLRHGPLVASSHNWQHVVEIVGYDDFSLQCRWAYGQKGCWIIKNSWGNINKYTWFSSNIYMRKGYVYIPYEGHLYSDLKEQVYYITGVEYQPLPPACDCWQQ